MKIKNSLADIIMEVLGLVMLIGTPLYLVIRWPSIPDKLPMHYNFAGEIDRWGGKGEVLFLVVMVWILYLMISLVEHFPSVWNTGVQVTPENRMRVYRTLKYMVKTLKLAMTLVFTFLIFNTVAGIPLPEWFTVVYVLLIIGDLAFWLIRLYRVRK
jgi:uncharacterized membrane protein